MQSPLFWIIIGHSKLNQMPFPLQKIAIKKRFLFIYSLHDFNLNVFVA
jgi:hypothetical protein